MSELIADLMAFGIGNWSNTEEAENELILDELIMLHERYSKHQMRLFRFQAAIQGVDMGHEEEEEEVGSAEELPPEILEHERAWQKKKQEFIDSGAKDMADFAKMGFGYEKKR